MSVDLQVGVQIRGSKGEEMSWLQVSGAGQKNGQSGAENAKRGDRIRRISVSNFSQEIKLWQEHSSEQRRQRQKTEESAEETVTQSSFRSVKERLLNERLKKQNQQSLNIQQVDSDGEQEVKGLGYQTFKMVKRRERDELGSLLVQSSCKASECNFRRSATHK